MPISRPFLTLAEVSKATGRGVRWLQTMCAEGRIPGAEKMGRAWIVPKDYKLPKLERGRPKK